MAPLKSYFSNFKAIGRLAPPTLGDWPTSSCGLYYGSGWDHSHFESETFGHGNRVELAGSLQGSGVVLPGSYRIVKQLHGVLNRI